MPTKNVLIEKFNTENLCSFSTTLLFNVANECALKSLVTNETLNEHLNDYYLEPNEKRYFETVFNYTLNKLKRNIETLENEMKK